MKKFILLLILVLAIFVAVNRQKLFVRDPLASLTRNGMKEAGTQVYINYSNEVLLQNDNAPAYLMVVQANNHVGAPGPLKCLHWMVCLADGDPVPLVAVVTDVKVEHMTNKVVEFRDGAGKEVVVKLR